MARQRKRKTPASNTTNAAARRSSIIRRVDYQSPRNVIPQRSPSVASETIATRILRRRSIAITNNDRILNTNNEAANPASRTARSARSRTANATIQTNDQAEHIIQRPNLNTNDELDNPAPRAVRTTTSRTNNHPGNFIERHISIESFQPENIETGQHEDNTGSDTSSSQQFDYYLQSIQAEFQRMCEPEFSQATKTECEMRLHLLESQMERLIEAHEHLQPDDGTETSANYEFLFKDASDTFAGAKRILTNRIAASSDTPIERSAQQIVVQFDAQMLKPIELPTFDGTYSKWREFKAQFVSQIHKKPNITNTDKMYRLKEALTGSAKLTLGSWEVNNENYLKAFEKLCSVYDNDYLIVSAHVQEILTLEPLQTPTAENIRKLIDTVTNAVQQLKVLNANTAELMLIQLVESKIDDRTRQAWDMQRHPNSIPTFDEMHHFLEKRARMQVNQEAYAVKNNKSERFQPYNKNRYNSGSNRRTTNAKFLTPLPPCRVCQGNHGLFKCAKFLAMSYATRLAKVEEWQLCNSCLGRKHATATCPKGYNCVRCPGEVHNSALCPKIVTYARNALVHTTTTVDDKSVATNAVESSAANPSE